MQKRYSLPPQIHLPVAIATPQFNEAFFSNSGNWSAKWPSIEVLERPLISRETLGSVCDRTLYAVEQAHPVDRKTGP